MVRSARLAPCPRTPNCVSSRAERASQRVAPIAFQGSGERAMHRLRTVLESLPRVEILESDPTYIRAAFSSRVFRFVDDLELLVSEAEGVVHVRSASRLGHWDWGANRRRVETLRRHFNALASRD